MKKIGLLIIPALLLTGCFQKNNSTNQLQNLQNTVEQLQQNVNGLTGQIENLTHPTTTPNTDLTTYHNQAYGFEITYPQIYTLYPSPAPIIPEQSFFKTGGDPLLSIEIPRLLYPKTNFSYAFLTISANRSSVAATECDRFGDPSGPIQPMVVQKVLGTTIFAYGTTTDAAAGTFANTRVYHVLKNKICYEAAARLFASNMGNYEPGAVTEVNYDEIWQHLENIIATWKFTAPVVIEGQVYNNTQLNFSLNLPDTWKGYRASVSGTSVHFEMPTKDTTLTSNGFVTLFALTRYTPNEWAKVPKDGPGPVKIVENTSSVYAYNASQDALPDDVQTAFAELPKIIASFKITP